MRKPAAYLFAMLVGSIIWFFFQHFKVTGTESLRVVPKTAAELNSTEGVGEEKMTAETERPSKGLSDFFAGLTKFARSDTDEEPASPGRRSVDPAKLKVASTRSRDTIRVASFHLRHFGALPVKPKTLEVVANVVKEFDVVALQGIAPVGMTIVGDLVARAGSEFELILGSPSATRHQDAQFAYIFNTNTIIADRGDGLYTLGDPDNLLLREPLVGWFRAKLAPADEAFTFTLVNVDIEQRRAQQELRVLDNAMREIRNDGRDEDDVIALGCFQASADELGELGQLPGLVATIQGVATDLRATKQTENILFRTPATVEWTRRQGVFQFLRAYNLTMVESLEVSDHLPVWAEFSIYEGGRRGRIASTVR